MTIRRSLPRRSNLNFHKARRQVPRRHLHRHQHIDRCSENLGHPANLPRCLLMNYRR
jgi:hypothetical protein